MAYKDLKKWRTKVIKEFKNAFDNRCGICGYDRCAAALDFHHINPSEKDFAISSWISMKWEILLKEVSKCILICSNCHREYHDGLIEIPTTVLRLDESKIKFTPYKAPSKTPCKVCSKPKHPKRQFCSNKCHGIHKAKGNKWDSINLEQLLSNGESYESIGRQVGVTGAAVKKRAQKFGYIT